MVRHIRAIGAHRGRSLEQEHPPDITQGSLARSIWHLAWPGMISQLLFMFPNLYDAVWLGQLGREAQAAAGLAMTVRFTMISVLMALSLGSGAVVARYVGARDYDKANTATMQAVILMVVSSGVLGLVGVVLARPLMVLSGADESTLGLAVRYARILFAGLIAMEMVPSLGYMISAAGAPKLMMGMTMWTAGVLLVAEPLMVRWMGLEGAALAMVGSQTVGMLWGLGLLVAGRAPVRLDLRHLGLDIPVIRQILRVATPAVLQRGTPNVAMSLLTRMIAAYGAPTLAAWIVARRLFDVAQIPSQGLSRAAPALVGQNLGAGQPGRAVGAVRSLARLVALTMVVILGLLTLFAPQVMALFSDDAETTALGAHILRVLGVGYLFFALNYVYDSAQGGAGDTLSPMVINLVALWVLQVPLAYVLSRGAGLGANGIWLALVLGWGLQLVLMWLRYRQGRWKSKRI